MIVPEVRKIEALNLPDEIDYNFDNPNEHDPDFIDIEIVDYLNTFGVYIDRQTNRDLGTTRTWRSIEKKGHHFKSYAPSQF